MSSQVLGLPLPGQEYQHSTQQLRYPLKFLPLARDAFTGDSTCCVLDTSTSKNRTCEPSCLKTPVGSSKSKIATCAPKLVVARPRPSSYHTYLSARFRENPFLTPPAPLEYDKDSVAASTKHQRSAFDSVKRDPATHPDEPTPLFIFVASAIVDLRAPLEKATAHSPDARS